MNSEDFKKDLELIFTKKRILNRVKELEIDDSDLFAIRNILWMMFDEDDNTSDLLTDIRYNSEQNSYYPVKYKNPKLNEEDDMDNIITQGYFNEVFPRNKVIKIDLGNRKVFANAIKPFITGEQLSGKAIYLSGVRGSGKSFLMKSIAQKLSKQGHKIGFVNTTKLSEVINREKGKKSAASFMDGPVAFIKSMLQTVDVLFIDDIGGEPITPEIRDDILFSILNYRAEREKLTFFTSAFTMKELVNVESQSKYNRNDTDKAIKLVNKIKELSKEIKLENGSFYDIEEDEE